MIEKLLESWLDSASERSYQASFVQMLAAQGYRVVHSTRHCALEYGKDVLAIAPDGVPCAYQLKGNPGGRLGLAEFRRDIQAQLVQLMSQPIVFPGVPTGTRHRSFLVSNGYFDEEVQRAVDDLNRGGYLSAVQLLSRGHLFDWAQRLGASLWPGELDEMRRMLGLFLRGGQEILPMKELASLLRDVLRLRAEDTPLKKPELARACPSAALLTGIGIHPFIVADNHFAVASAWCLHATSVIAACERCGEPLRGSARESLRLAEAAIKDALVALWEEVQERKHLVEGNAMADPEVFGWRYTLLCGLFSVLWFFPGDRAEDRERRQAISTWLQRRDAHLHCWGEAAIPSILAFLLFLRRTDPTSKPDHELAALLRTVVASNQPRGKEALADPYYGFEEVAWHRLGLHAFYERADSTFAEETFAGSSFTAELLLQLVARSTWKQPCKDSWPGFSRLGHKRFVPGERWQYCLLECSDGVEETRQYPRQYRWEQLRRDAAVETCDYLPPGLAARPHLLLLWVMLVPQRLTSDVGRFLAAKLPGH